MLELNEDQKNQLRGLPDVDARRNVDEIVGMRENNQGDAHRADESFLFSLTNEMLELNEDQKNQLRGLPDVDARRNVDEIVGMRENDQGDGHRADGASTSSEPSSGPPNQSQP
ncbi:unnamed protein product [Brassica napus]|uniref:(rape) hypothetical protein n=1 Tax=Brassica napus TaxID=3708 RepID=A0A816VQN4_BRANA|nr:unnamed protein product [Brassica napus]